MLARVVGQDRAVRDLSSLYDLALSGLNAQNRPIGSMLFLGPTGSGKTWLAQAAADVLYGSPQALTRIDCAEYQQPHEVARIGGLPSYSSGRVESTALLHQESLDRRDRRGVPLSLVLFDDIEKASPVLWQLLVGVLDHGTLALGDGRRVDFRRSIVLMSSNLGADEIFATVTGGGGIGFTSQNEQVGRDHGDARISDQVRRAVTEAARRQFPPEFLNRIDKTVVFQPIGGSLLRDVLDLELATVQRRILRDSPTKFTLRLDDRARELLLREGTDRRYGARHLKRAIDRLLLTPIARLVTSCQVGTGDVIEVQADENSAELEFHRLSDVGSSSQTVTPRAQVVQRFLLPHSVDRDRQAAIALATAVAVSAAVGLATGLTAAGLPLRRIA